MTAWLLLLLTLGCAWLCYDASRLKAPLRDEHPNTREGNSRMVVEGVYAPFGLGVLGWIFLLMTILLGVLTVRDFLD
ncbi:hypothetical protein CLU85_0463 [Acidovorax sp. 69]|uniref:hypothetical protein n=1 Tax=Acidovorax sp. 69 TaxID=2035202 RepID=UPI000CC47171|nr:hypothetical protein [Acidovorax sp. 69]PJI95738.1 hypothetical protein CLU85_0463 [Acidovorax sp. 69]